MKIGVLVKTSKITSTDSVEAFTSYLQSLGYQTSLFYEPKDVDGVDVVIVLGGDGAILHTAIPAAKKNIKIIGVNYGTLGFLTQYEKDERNKIAELLKSLETGDCSILKRSVLEVDIAGRKYYALNEFSLHRSLGTANMKPTQLLRIQTFVGEESDLIAGDGLLLCTPTGSTAYSMSAGGAILTPQAPVFMLTPICAFSMRSRPVVFPDSEEFAFRVVSGQAVLSIDGVILGELPKDATVFVKKATFTADFPVRANTGFLTRVRSKLNE